MRGDHFKRIGFALVVGLFGLGQWSGRAVAGPGTYDPSTRTFSLTYTYATVPGIIFDAQLDQLGQVKSVSQDQDAKIRAYFAAVSDKLWEATNQRGKIGSFTCVDNVKQADVIVNPSGMMGRGGYATPGGFEDRQGHLVVSYDDLTQSGKDIDAQLTIFHELCHYLFALPDEYRDGEPVGMCPLQNGSGPGCLMDNYWYDGPRHGWYGRFCADDHNAMAPNPITVITGQSARQTCAQLIDLFFQNRLQGAAAVNPPTPAATASTTAVGGTGASAGTSDTGSQPTPADPFSGIFANLVDATGSFLRDLVQRQKDQSKTPPSASDLRSKATKFLKNQVAFGRQTGGNVTPTADQIKQGVEKAIQTALTMSISPPARFTQPVVDQVLQMAKQIAAKELAKTSNSTLLSSATLTSAAAQTRATTTLQRKVERELLTFAKVALGLTDPNLSSDQRALSPDEKAYIKQVATDAASQSTSNDNSPLGRYLAAAQIHIKISQLIARAAVDTRDELGIPGTDIFRNILSDTDVALAKLALPGAPFQGFGLRRTVIFAPKPIDPKYDSFPLQASPSFTYWRFRGYAVQAIRSLITREKFLVLPEDMSPPLADPGTETTATRLQDVLKQIDFLTDQVKRSRFDNIIAIVPAGGLPENLGDQLESLRKRMALHPDVRLDIVQVDTGNVPERLIDLCNRSRGSWLLAFDSDLLGAAGQRLRGEGTAGSWVIAPDSGQLDLTPTDPKAAAPPAPDPTQTPRPLSLKFRRNRLFLFNNLPTQKDPQKALSTPLDAGKQPKLQRVVDTLEGYRKSVTPKDAPQDIGLLKVYQDLYGSPFFSLDLTQDNVKSFDWGDGKLGPPAESNTIFLGTDKNKLLHLQVFGADKSVPLLEKTEGSSDVQGSPLSDLKQQVTSPKGQDLSIPDKADDKAKLIADVRAIFDQTETGYEFLSLTTMRNELLQLTDPAQQPAGEQQQAKDFVARVAPRLDALRKSLDDLDTVLESLNVSVIDQASATKAIQAAISAQRKLAMLPPDGGTVDSLSNSLNVLYGSAAMRAAIEQAVLERMKRFDSTRKQLVSDLTSSANGQAQIQQVAKNASTYQDYTALIDAFTKIFRNCRKFDLLQQKTPTQQDSFRTLAEHFDNSGWDPNNSSWDPNALTTLGHRYLQLLAEIYLDLTDLQMELKRGDQSAPTYGRVPRTTLSVIPLGNAGVALPDVGNSLVTQLLAQAPTTVADPNPIDLKAFTAEEKASFDLVVGFSRSMNFTQFANDDPPVLRLYDSTATEQGAPFLQLDPAMTSNHMLVFRLPYPNRDAGRIGSGAYSPKLSLKQKHLPTNGDQVNYTFSVASQNPNVLFTATLRQIAIRAGDNDEQNDDEVASRGIIETSKSVGIIEALVTAGSPVQNVDVTGTYQKYELAGGPVRPMGLTFKDDGIWPDTTANDGVYTAKITLDPQETRKKAVYRVFLEAKSNAQTAFVPPETFGTPATTTTSTTTTTSAATTSSATTDTTTPAQPNPPKMPAVPKFQRATSVTFYVKGS